MTSATLGGGVNQILTFIDCGGGKAGQSESDILLTHAEKRGGMPEVADTKFYFGGEKN